MQIDFILTQNIFIWLQIDFIITQNIFIWMQIDLIVTQNIFIWMQMDFIVTQNIFIWMQIDFIVLNSFSFPNWFKTFSTDKLIHILGRKNEHVNNNRASFCVLRQYETFFGRKHLSFGFLMFLAKEKAVSSLVSIHPVTFGTVNLMKVFTIVALCIFETLFFIPVRAPTYAVPGLFKIPNISALISRERKLGFLVLFTLFFIKYSPRSC